MRIIHTECSTDLGGQERRVVTESAGMRDRGHQVWIVTPGDGGPAERARQLGVAVVPLQFSGALLPLTATRLRSLFAGIAPDVVNSHGSRDSWACAVAFALGRRTGALVRSRHHSAPVTPGPLHRFLYRQPDFVITTGENTRSGLANSGLVPLDRSQSIPTGVDLDLFGSARSMRDSARRALGLASETPVVGVLAFLRRGKGHAVLLEAIPAIRRRVPDSVLLVIGDGEERRRLERQADDLLTTGAVRFLGAREDIPALLGALDVLCLPSTRNEGVPQSLLQGSAAGLPVVGTSVGGIPEAVVEGVTGRLVPPGDAAALAEAISGILADPEAAGRMGERGREHVRIRFSSSRMLDLTEEAYARAVRLASDGRARP